MKSKKNHLKLDLSLIPEKKTYFSPIPRCVMKNLNTNLYTKEGLLLDIKLEIDKILSNIINNVVNKG